MCNAGAGRMMDTWKPGQPVRLETPRFLLRSMTRLQAAWHSYPWTSDPAVMHPFGLPAGTWTRRSWYKRFRKPNNKRRFCLGIWPKDQSKMIGYESFDVSSRGVAVLSVLIGDHDWWGKGVVQETRGAIVDFLFEKAGCERVWGTPSIRNFPSVFNYQKLGFTCEGTLRKHGFDPGTQQRVDFFVFAMLREEWLKKSEQQGAA